MKKNNLRYIVTFVGAVLVLSAIIAVSRSLVSPHPLKAQGVSNGGLSQTSTISLSEPKTLSSTERRESANAPFPSLGTSPLPNPNEAVSDVSKGTAAPTPSFPQIPSLPMSENVQKSADSSHPVSAPPRLSNSLAASTASSPSAKTQPLNSKQLPPLTPSAASDVPFPALPPLPANAATDTTANTTQASIPQKSANNSVSFPASETRSNSVSSQTVVDRNEKNPLPISSGVSKELPSLLSENGTPASSGNSQNSPRHTRPSNQDYEKSETANVRLSAPAKNDSMASLPSGTANAPLPPMPNIPVHNSNEIPAFVPTANSAVSPAPNFLSNSVANSTSNSATNSASSVRKPSSDFIDPMQTVSKPAASNLSAAGLPASNSLVIGSSALNAQNSNSARSNSVSNQTSSLIGSGIPGETSLEGEQHAQIVIFKDMPNEVQVGREETFTIRVKNIGNREAKEVVLQEQLPAKTRLVKMDPQGTIDAKGYLIWNNFDLAPSQEKAFTYKAIPLEQGEIGSIASISFRSEASGRTKCTKPELKVEVNAPKEVEIGDDVPLEILISNTGTGTATGVTIVENVPKGLTHSGGTVLDNQIDKIAAGEAKKLSLTLKGANPGKTVNILKLTADNGTQKEIQTEIQINAPELKLEFTGAGQRFLERESTYVLKVSNPGTAIAKNIGIEVKLPENVTFVKTNNYGLYKKENHSVCWELVELPQNIEPGEIELVVMPSKLGKGKFLLNAKGDKGLTTEISKELFVDGLAALSYIIKPMADVVEVGKNAVYEIRIANHGTKSSANVNLQVLIPDEMKMVESDGPTKYRIQNGAIVFDNLASIGAKQEVVYKLKTICSAPGDHRIKVQVSSDDFERLVKEESIRAYH